MDRVDTGIGGQLFLQRTNQLEYVTQWHRSRATIFAIGKIAAVGNEKNDIRLHLKGKVQDGQDPIFDDHSLTGQLPNLSPIFFQLFIQPFKGELLIGNGRWDEVILECVVSADVLDKTKKGIGIQIVYQFL